MKSWNGSYLGFQGPGPRASSCLLYHPRSERLLDELRSNQLSWLEVLLGFWAVWDRPISSLHLEQPKHWETSGYISNQPANANISRKHKLMGFPTASAFPHSHEVAFMRFAANLILVCPIVPQIFLWQILIQSVTTCALSFFKRQSLPEFGCGLRLLSIVMKTYHT